jgi:hypothetical protein
MQMANTTVDIERLCSIHPGDNAAEASSRDIRVIATTAGGATIELVFHGEAARSLIKKPPDQPKVPTHAGGQRVP